MRGQKDLRTMKKGVNYIKNQGAYLYKMFQNCQIVQFEIQLSMTLNGIETN